MEAEMTESEHIKASPNNLSLTKEEKLREASILKQEGNSFFKQNDYKNAMKKYHRALLYVKGLVDQPIPFGALGLVNGDEEINEELKEKIKQMEFTCYGNLAACHMKTSRWQKVVEYSEKVLTHQPNNAKALFRRGQAYFHLKNLDRAQEDLNKAEALEPSDTAIKKMLILLDKEFKNVTEKEKRTYAAMFENMHV